MAQTASTNSVPAEAKKNMTSGTSTDYKELSDQIATLKKDLAGMTELIGEIGLRRKDETVAAARERAEYLRERGHDALSEAQIRAGDAQEQAFAAIRRQPGTAIGIAAAIGFLAGLMTSRK